MLTDQHITTVKSTIPLLEDAGVALTGHFYQRLFLHNPELQDIFNMSNQHSGRQQVALFQAIAAYAKNIDNLAVLTTAVERIAQKHTSFNIQADHYAIVGHHLIETLRELAGDVFTADIEEAWTKAYGFLAQIFIDRESALYQQRAETKGGWSGRRLFRLIEKRLESEWVKSLVFEPVDKKPVISYLPGQYIGIEVQPAGADYREIRQYSLSDKANGETYRISVKRETLGVPGVVSNFLHDGLRLGDEVNLNAPAGDFFFKDRQTPVVLVSAGVGLTPMQAIAETLIAQQYSRPIHYLHACENIEQHSFERRLTQLTAHENIFQHTWYKTGHVVSKHMTERQKFHHGYMDLSSIENDLPLATANFYLCGPIAFMQFAKKQLLTLGVASERIHYEVFGPHEDF